MHITEFAFLILDLRVQYILGYQQEQQNSVVFVLKFEHVEAIESVLLFYTCFCLLKYNIREFCSSQPRKAKSQKNNYVEVK